MVLEIKLWFYTNPHPNTNASLIAIGCWSAAELYLIFYQVDHSSFHARVSVYS